MPFGQAYFVFKGISSGAAAVLRGIGVEAKDAKDLGMIFGAVAGGLVAAATLDAAGTAAGVADIAANSGDGPNPPST